MNPKLKTQLFLISSCWASSAFSNTVSSTSDLHNQIKAVKENVRRERKNVDGLRRVSRSFILLCLRSPTKQFFFYDFLMFLVHLPQNIQTNLTASGNSTTVTSSVVSSNVTMSKNPFRNPEPFNGESSHCLIVIFCVASEECFPHD